MIRTLRKRFVFFAMAAITVLLLFLLGAINIGNIYVSERQNEQMITVLLDEKNLGKPPRTGNRPRGFLDVPNDENSRMSAVYFTVRVDSNNNIFEIDTDRIADISDDEAKELFQAVKESGTDEGKIQNFRYKASKNERDGSTVYLFLDTTIQLRNILSVVFFSVVAGIFCWLAMLFFVVLISKRVVRPIAENISRQKQFVTDAGHEIKTPLAIILSNTEAMELYEGENKWSKNIREQTIRLSGLMQNLLTLAKADEGQSVIKWENFSLSLTAEETLNMFSEPIELKGLTVTKQIEENIFFKADKEQIRRLMSVLFDNAVKYSPTNGEVHIFLQRHGKSIVFGIRNDCENLPQCTPDKLFDRFYRADDARTREKGGYGIGLSAAKTIVELYGGTIKADYLQPNQILFTATFT